MLLEETPLAEFVRLHVTERLQEVDNQVLRVLEDAGAVVVFSAEEEMHRVNVWFVCRHRVDVSDIEPEDRS